ncbi:MAG TPA: phosphate/phosphite/phosphonate ABC transporter substrate-binding protein [Thermodesulfobacteriota bacterium]|nr:phosphate/phosphite/phosphonate ABC transporter substrate-binding protein [Thermodesulfobacteriota bacterium]
MSRLARVVFTLLLLGTAAVLLKGYLRPPLPPLRVAFQVCNSIEENRARFEPLGAYLEKKLGRKIVVSHVNTFDFIERAQRREFDVLQSNSYVYINVKEKTGGTLLAREVKSDTGKDTGGLIVVRADSPIRTLYDLKGKKMVFGPVLSPGGYLAQYYTMLSAGLDPEKTLASYTFLPGAWQHEKVVYSVLYGAVDAGAVKVGDIERMEAEGKVRKSDFRVIAASPPVPNCTFYALPHVDAETSEKVRKALLDLSDRDFVAVNGERLNVLKRDGTKGYVPARDEEYDILRKMARAANLPPYEKY